MKEIIRKKTVFWGIFLLASAAFILLGGLGLFGDVSAWSIIFSALLLIWFLESLVKLRWGGMLFSLAFIAILFDEVLGIEDITPWPVLFAALLGSIGLNLIFKNKQDDHCFVNVCSSSSENMNNGASLTDEQKEDNEMFQCEVSFGSAAKYVNSQDLKIANLKNAFGSLMIYFDHARISDGKAIANIDNAFGKMTLYIPKEWDTKIEVTKAFGNVVEYGRKTGENKAVFVVRGEVAFGQLEIQYI